jgi:hypothetical protein
MGLDSSEKGASAAGCQMKPIPLVRFDALAGYARKPMIRILAEELSWFEHADERVLGLVNRDRTDNDFGGHVFGRDRKGRFRWIAGTDSRPTAHQARIALRLEMERQAALPDEEFYQGDEKGRPVDFFATVADEAKLNPNFVSLRQLEEYSAARQIIEPMMRWYEDVDGNFVEQFQTTGFDTRIWELYLFASFTELNFEIARIHAVPDFSCANLFGEFCVEAVTVNPTRDKTGAIVPPPPTDTPEQLDDYLKSYMPIRFAGVLKAKLEKRYWEKPHVEGKPLLLAVHDFSSPGSMTYTRSAFERYIYGIEHHWEKGGDGQLIIKPRRVGTLKWGTKEVPCGFIELPDAENVSAVLFSNSGTISKFNRMGKLAGFGSERLELVRIGTAVNHDPNAVEPLYFKRCVGEAGYDEHWAEGIDIWHNPRAKHPLDPELLPGVAHHMLLPDGNVQSLTPDWFPLGSITLHALKDEKADIGGSRN